MLSNLNIYISIYNVPVCKEGYTYKNPSTRCVCYLFSMFQSLHSLDAPVAGLRCVWCVLVGFEPEYECHTLYVMGCHTLSRQSLDDRQACVREAATQRTTPDPSTGTCTRYRYQYTVSIPLYPSTLYTLH